MTNNQIRFFILLGIFAVPFVPLIVSPSLFFPFITGKAFVFRTIIQIIFACYVVLAVRDKEYRPKFTNILGSLSLFMLVIAVANFFAENPFKAFWSNYERMEGYIGLLHLFAYFVVLGSVFKTKDLWNKLFATSLFVSFIMSIYSFLQITDKIKINQGGVRVDGTLGNAGYLAIYMVFHIFIAGILYLRSNSEWQKFLSGLVAVLNLIVLYYTATRGAVLGLLGGALVAFVYLLFKSENGSKIRKFALFGILGLSIFVGLFISFRNTSFVENSPVLSRFSSLSINEIKTQGRYFVWPMAIKGFFERPTIGWGQEGFNFVFNKNYDPRMYNQEAWFDRAHSAPLDWLIAGGILGLVSYILILGATIFGVFKIDDDKLTKNEKALVLGLVSAYIFNNLFVFDQISSYILFFTFLAYVHSNLNQSLNCKIWNYISNKCSKVLDNDGVKPVLEASVVIALLLSLYFVVYVPWRQNKNLLYVLQISNQNQIGKIEEYKKPLSSYGMWFPESLEHLYQVMISLALNPNAPLDLKQDLAGTIDKSFKKHIDKVPNDARYRVFYSDFLSKFGYYDRAISELDVATKLSPKKQSIYFALVNNFLAEGKNKEALEKAKYAYELETSYEDAKMIYAYTLISSGDGVSANKILSEIDEQKFVFDDRYLNILFNSGQHQKMINVAKRRVELDPSNLQHRLTLATVYLKSERRADAIVTLQELINLNPSFKQAGEYYIKEIQAGRNP